MSVSREDSVKETHLSFIHHYHHTPSPCCLGWVTSHSLISGTRPCTQDCKHLHTMPTLKIDVRPQVCALWYFSHFVFFTAWLVFLAHPRPKQRYTNLKVNSTAKVKAPKPSPLPLKVDQNCYFKLARLIVEDVFAQTILSDTSPPSVKFSMASICHPCNALGTTESANCITHP